MTSFVSRNLKQTAVYWASPSSDGYGGNTFDSPVEIDCRWEKKQQLFVDGAGKEALSSAVVYLGQDVDLSGYLYLGDLDDIASSVTGPEDVSGAYEIRGFDKIPTLKATDYLRKAWL